MVSHFTTAIHSQSLLKGSSSPSSVKLTPCERTVAVPSHRAGIDNIPKKPMRPLTAYHIYFQIEREYVIQTSAGEVANKSMMDNKILLKDVPQRYQNIRLLPDWYAGPGKRQKRKHRKQHGKIGFLELSRIISTRWATLGETDPETKAFVTKIAKTELEEYYREMKEYKELTKDMLPEDLEPPKSTHKHKKKTKKRSIGDFTINPTSHMQQLQPRIMAPGPDMVLSSYHPVGNFMPTVSAQLQCEIDHFLSYVDNRAQHLMLPPRFCNQNQSIPPSFETNGDNSNQVVQKKMKVFHDHHRQDNGDGMLQFDSSLDVSSHFDQICSQKSSQQQSSHQYTTEQPLHRAISNGSSSCASPSLPRRTSSMSAVEVDICDDEILKIWRSHND